jgi:hypothetical protein
MLRRLSADQQRSVRHWLMEFVAVVAGVLLALWLQQWDQQRRERAEMLAAEQSVHDELRESLKSLIWRQAISKCHEDRVELIQTELLKDSARWPGINDNAIFTSVGTLPVSLAHSVYQRPVDTFTDSAWTSALATGALQPMERNRFNTLVGLYDAVHYLQKTRELEDRAATTLSPLGFPIELTPEIRTDMLRAVYDVDRSRFTFAFFSAAGLAGTMRQLGWDDRKAIDDWIIENRRDAAASGLKFRPCVSHEQNPFRAAVKR